MQIKDELIHVIRKILPDSQFDIDENGQIIIYTNLKESDWNASRPFNGRKLVPMDWEKDAPYKLETE